METFLSDILQPAFWVAVGQIIGVNVILSGDNAVVIALACRLLPARQRVWGMILGAGVAVLLRVFFTLVIAEAMQYPYLKIVGGILLFWVALKLIVPDEAEGGQKVGAAESLWRAVSIIAVADVVMSLDNVIAIAASAESAAMRVNLANAEQIKAILIIFGLATSIPLIVAGSALLMALLERFPAFVWAGAGLLGWIAGDILITDVAITSRLGTATVDQFHDLAAGTEAVLVVCTGYLIRKLRRRAEEKV